MLTVLPFVPVRVIDPTIIEKAIIQPEGLSPTPTRTCVLLGWVEGAEEDGEVPLDARLLETPRHRMA